MANRQHGRSPSGGRPHRTVPVSRFPVRGAEDGRTGLPVYSEPEVRRWPHPLEDSVPSGPAPEPALHYIRCALSYQNQLLADIKALLERLAAGEPAVGKTQDPEKGGENLSKL